MKLYEYALLLAMIDTEYTLTLAKIDTEYTHLVNSNDRF